MDTIPPDLPVALVVEDDAHIGLLLRFMLERDGYRVQLAEDGLRAEAAILTQPPPAVALFDVMLPHRDGFTLVALARAQPGWAAVPILMLTAKAREQDTARALEVGANGHLAKPFQPQDLLARLRALRGAAT